MWFHEGKEFTDEDIKEYVGFVYRVKNLQTGKMYIGKKNFWSRVSKPPLKGKKRRRVSKKQSDWKTYFGSNEAIKKDVESLGADKFYREILHLCRSKGEMSFYEVKYQIEYDVLRSSMFYNDFIGCKIHRRHLLRS